MVCLNQFVQRYTIMRLHKVTNCFDEMSEKQLAHVQKIAMIMLMGGNYLKCIVFYYLHHTYVLFLWDRTKKFMSLRKNLHLYKVNDVWNTAIL